MCEHVWWERFRHAPNQHPLTSPTGRICKLCNHHTYTPCNHPEEHKRSRVLFEKASEVPVLREDWCAVCGERLPPLDASYVLVYNTNVRKENTVDYEKRTLIWHPLTPDDVPHTRTVVLLKLKVQPLPLRVIPPTSEQENESKRALVQRGVFYGYVTAVLDFNLDGFGRQVPACFRVLTPAWDLNCMTVERTSISFDKVEAWAVL